jgi:hypothetical protein
VFVDTEEACVNYLAGVSPGNVSVQMPIIWQIPLTAPFILIERCSGSDDRVSEKAIVDVHTFHSTRDLASRTARYIHYLMMIWTPKVGVSMSTGDIVHVDLVETIHGPVWADYGDENLKRYTARYQITSRITAQSL